MIDKKMSSQILMVGVYYKNNAPGGMASVVATYDRHFDHLRYISTWKWSNKLVKIYYAIQSISLFTILLTFDRRIKIIHIHGAAHNSFFRKKIFIDLAHHYKKKIVYHIHASQFKVFFEESDKKEVIIKTILKCDKLIVLSKSWAAYFINKGIPAKKIEILNNIVPKPKLNKKDLTDNRVKFLFLGEIGNRKGIFDLLTAIKENKGKLEDKILLSVGGNGEVERLKQFIDENELGGLVRFLGWVSGEKKIDELNATDVYILPSHNEGLPISILEAFSYGLPVISTPVGGIPEIVETGKNGILVEPGNVNQIKDALLFFVNQKSAISQFGDQNREIVKDFYPETVISSLNNVYKELVNSN